jgi:hypothetical protein
MSTIWQRKERKEINSLEVIKAFSRKFCSFHIISYPFLSRRGLSREEIEKITDGAHVRSLTF